MENSTPGTPPKTIALISYLTFFGWIAALVLNSNKEPLATFHIRQTLGLNAMLVALTVINIIPILGQIVWLIGGIALFVLWIMGIISANNGEMKPVPIVGELFQKWFQNVNL